MRRLLDAQAASIGIIGGADGPTAIFIAGGFPSWLIPAIYAALLILMLVAVLLNRK